MHYRNIIEMCKPFLVTTQSIQKETTLGGLLPATGAEKRDSWGKKLQELQFKVLTAIKKDAIRGLERLAKVW